MATTIRINNLTKKFGEVVALDHVSLIIEPGGNILADTRGEQKLITADVNLDERIFERWLSVSSYGEWKGLYPKERRSETYKSLSVFEKDK